MPKYVEGEAEPEDGLLVRSFERLVNADPLRAQQTFTAVVWDGLGFQSVPLLGSVMPGAKITDEGDDAGVGRVRRVPGAWAPIVREQVLEVTPGEQIVYTVTDNWPASYHRGYVTFEAAEPGKTLVTWTVKAVPFACTGWLNKLLFWFTFPTNLRSLHQAIDKENKRAKKRDKSRSST